MCDGGVRCGEGKNGATSHEQPRKVLAMKLERRRLKGHHSPLKCKVLLFGQFFIPSAHLSHNAGQRQRPELKSLKHPNAAFKQVINALRAIMADHCRRLNHAQFEISQLPHINRTMWLNWPLTSRESQYPDYALLSCRASRSQIHAHCCRFCSTSAQRTLICGACARVRWRCEVW